MKKKLLFYLFCIIVSSNLLAQDADEKKYSLLINPLFLLVDIITPAIGLPTFAMDMEGQYKINDIFNLSLVTSFFVNWTYSPISYQIIIKPMLIYRPLRTGLKGFYLGLYSFIGWDCPGSYGSQIFTQIGTGFNTGYKWILRNGFTIQLGTGIGKTWYIPDKTYIGIAYVYNSDGRLTLYYYDFHILDFKLGYSF